MARVGVDNDEKRLKDSKAEYVFETEFHATQVKVRAHCAGLDVAPIGSLHPTAISTFIHSGDVSFHKISSCPRCSLGFHCNNWVPGSCGHSYHPHCLASLLECCGYCSPYCMACNEVFYPDWLLCWGINSKHKDLLHLESVLHIHGQRDILFENILKYYADQPMVASIVVDMVATSILEPPIPISQVVY